MTDVAQLAYCRNMPRAHGALIRQRREELDLSTAALAEKVQVREGTVRNVENGNTTASMRLLHRISRELEVPVVELIAKDVATGDASGETTHPQPTHPPNKKREQQRLSA